MKYNWLLALTIFMGACSNSSDNQTTTQQDSTNAEPTYWDSIQEYNPQKMELVLDGKRMELIYFKQNEDLVYKALEISKELKPLKRTSEIKLDVTDDGIEDSIIFYVQKHDSFAFEKGIRVFDRGRLVFSDSAIADSGYADWLESLAWLGDSAFRKLMPYSMMASLDFGDSLDSYLSNFHPTKFLEDNEERVNRFVSKYCEETSDDPLNKQRDIMIYLNIYTGKTVREIQLYEPQDELMYIWYKPDSAFIPIYSYTD